MNPTLNSIVDLESNSPHTTPRSTNNENDHDNQKDPIQNNPQHNDNHNNNQNQKEKENHKLLHAIVNGISLWLRILTSNAAGLTATILSMVIIYEPARIVSPDIRDSLRDTCYENVHIILNSISIFSCYSYCFIHIFGFRNVIHHVYGVFGLSLLVILYLYYGINSLRAEFFAPLRNFLLLSPPFLALWLVHRTSLPSNPSLRTQSMFAYTKDGTCTALAKGWISFFLAFFIIISTTKIYLEASITMQFIIRLFLMPLLFFIVNFVQHLVLVGLSLDHMDKRLLVASCTSQWMQFYARFLTSNVSTDEAGSAFILINLGTMVVEVLSRLSFLHRYMLYRRFKVWIRNKKRLNAPAGRQRRISVARNNFVGSAYVDSEHGHGEEPRNRSTTGTTMATISDYTKEMRAKQIVEEVGTELRVLVIVPLMMYLVHPIRSDSDFETIGDVNELLYQIFVQLGFEAVGDIFCLTIEPWYLGIPIDSSKIKGQDEHMWLRFAVSWVCFIACAGLLTG
eukprot:TRINITY_DN10561_c0_g1_i2.p1 TRINITY_DN10561_c0_g1~~TRINITY_DN10561_c0_g1_i2.p1  ORF type:complete len:510 (-),score=113.86 TRINITY_DN10561_c0_g1_i2:510-2039(-)